MLRVTSALRDTMLVAEKSPAIQDLASEIKQLREEVTRLKNAAPKPRLEWHLMQLVSEQENDIRRLREELASIQDALKRERAKTNGTGTNLSPQDKIEILEDTLLKALHLIADDRQRINETDRFTRQIWNEFKILNIIAHDYMLAKHPDYFIIMERVEELIGNPDMTTFNSFVPLPQATVQPASGKK